MQALSNYIKLGHILEKNGPFVNNNMSAELGSGHYIGSRTDVVVHKVPKLYHETSYGLSGLLRA